MDKKNFLTLLVCTVLAAFTGAFLAIYLTAPKHKPLMPPPEISERHQKPFAPDGFENPLEQQEKSFEHDMEFFDKFESDMDDLIQHSPNVAGFIQMNNVGLKTSETPKAYKIEIDLKPFGNSDKNILLKVKGNTIKISAGYQSKDKDSYNSSQFYQALTLPAKIDASAIKKEKQGSLLIITIPKK